MLPVYCDNLIFPTHFIDVRYSLDALNSNAVPVTLTVPRQLVFSLRFPS